MAIPSRLHIPWYTSDSKSVNYITQKQQLLVKQVQCT